MPQTLAEKIIAKAARVDSVTPGEIVTCHVDLAMMHDSAGPRMAGAKLDELGVPVWDSSNGDLMSFNCGGSAYLVSEEKLREEIGPQLVALARGVEVMCGPS